jgi:hypothetical protein
MPICAYVQDESELLCNISNCSYFQPFGVSTLETRPPEMFKKMTRDKVNIPRCRRCTISNYKDVAVNWRWEGYKDELRTKIAKTPIIYILTIYIQIFSQNYDKFYTLCWQREDFFVLKALEDIKILHTPWRHATPAEGEERGRVREERCLIIYPFIN